MSMWVRLVGGINNGDVEKIDDDQVEIVKVVHVPAPVARVINRSLNSHSVEVKKTKYTRRQVDTAGKSITYFAVEGFSDFDALTHVLGP